MHLTSKDRKHERVLAAVARILSAQGIAAVNPSRVARTSGVSRGWIYKYLGGQSDRLVEITVQHFAERFTDLKPPQLDLGPEAYLQQLESGFSDLLERSRHHPEILSLYFYITSQSGPLSRYLRQALDQHLERESQQLRTIFRRSDKEARETAAELAAIRLGLAHSVMSGELATLGHAAATITAKRSFQALLTSHPCLTLRR